jgi:hypothetical protein
VTAVEPSSEAIRDGQARFPSAYPSLPQRVRYHHLPDQDVWTYKQNYGEIFLSSNLTR